jgi:hypothetical protein
LTVKLDVSRGRRTGQTAALSNGHDLMVSEVPPEPTLDATYAKWVLGLEGDAMLSLTTLRHRYDQRHGR